MPRATRRPWRLARRLRIFTFKPCYRRPPAWFGTLNPATLATVSDIPLNVPNAGFATAIAGGPAGIIQFGPVTGPGCQLGSPTNPCFSPFIYPMPEIDQYSTGATVGPVDCTPGVDCTVTTPSGGSYAYDKGYVFILVGDPLQPQTCPAGSADVRSAGGAEHKSGALPGLPDVESVSTSQSKAPERA